MSDVTVLSRTQIIKINPTSRAVSIINAGPQGPAGPEGPPGGGGLTAEQAVDAVASALVAGNEIEITYDDPGDTLTIDYRPEEVVHDWNVDGWAPFNTILINDDVPTGTPGTQTLSVVNRRGRITNSGTQESMRIVYEHDDTLWMDSEVTSLWWGSDVFNNGGSNPALPQGGHFHRGYYDEDGNYRVIAISNNIFLSDVNVINANVWNHDVTETAPGGLDIGAAGAQKAYTDNHLRRAARVCGVNRFNFISVYNEYQVTPGDHGFNIGDMVSVDIILDATFGVATPTAIAGVGNGMVQIIDAESGANVTSKYENGTIIGSSIHGQRYWPYWVKSRLIGSKLWVKVWRYRYPEPDWADSNAVFTADFAGANNPAPDALYPDQPGRCGLVGNHLRNNRWFEYGYFSAKKL